MKHFLTTLIALIASFGFSQTPSSKHDFFVQYNGNTFAKKVNLDLIVNHPFLLEFKKHSSDFNSEEFSTLFKLDQNASIVGNFTDSIPYYQITIPIKNKDKIKQFLIKTQQKKQAPDSLAQYEIKDFSNYSLFTSNNQKLSMAWNDSYLVILEFTKKYSDVDPTKSIDEAAMTVDSVATAPPVDEKYGDPVVPAPAEIVEEPVVDTAAPVESKNTYAEDNSYHTKYENRKTAFDSIQKIKQTDFLKSLFEKGYVVPTSTKINSNADISSWVDYGGILSGFGSSLNTLTKMTPYGKYFPTQKRFGSFIKGMNFDFYFDNDNARIEETVEYSKEVASILSEINARKINKRIFNYFPEKEPLAFLTYHFNSEKVLEKTPELATEIFANTFVTKEDLSLVTDLISTIVDEKASATLFDGDLSLFLHDIQNKEVTAKATEYNDNFEAITVEKKINKTVPLFSVIFTSTHPTFGDKLILLGLRKKALLQKENYYEFAGNSEYGNFFLIKDKDVVVITNSFENLKNNNSEFVNDIKKELKRNYFTSRLNIKRIVDTYSNIEKTTAKSATTLTKVASKFKNVVVQSPKKITDNKLMVEFRLNTVETNENVMLQTLDLLKEINK